MACKWPIANIPCHAPSAGKVNVRYWPKAAARISEKVAFERPLLGKADIHHYGSPGGVLT